MLSFWYAMVSLLLLNLSTPFKFFCPFYVDTGHLNWLHKKASIKIVFLFRKLVWVNIDLGLNKITLLRVSTAAS